MLHRIAPAFILLFLLVAFAGIRGDILLHHHGEIQQISRLKTSYRWACQKWYEADTVEDTCSNAAPSDQPSEAECHEARALEEYWRGQLYEITLARKEVEQRIPNPVTRFLLSPSSRWLCSGDGRVDFAW